MRQAVVITVSSRAAAGHYADRAGPAVVELLAAEGFAVSAPVVVTDGREPVSAALVEACEVADLVVTAGGTGLHPKDLTPEATTAVVDRVVPGIAEAMRAASLRVTPMAMLSRAQAGVRGRTLIVNLPGSPTAAIENLEAVIEVLGHALEQLAGGDH